MKSKSSQRHSCRLCESRDLERALHLAPTPAANAFLKEEELNLAEPTFPLDLHLCRNCEHLQLLEVVDPEWLFRNYVYVSGTSPSFVSHFEKLASQIQSRLANPKDPRFVVEIGSNDGTLLRFFQKMGHEVLGIDPAQQISEKANQEGIPTWNDFYTRSLAQKILESKGPADVVVANNVFAHIDDLRGTTLAIRDLLRPNGFFVFEVSYLVDVLEKTLFDTIYHEHLDYHSLTPLLSFFERLDMKVFDAERIPTHGGSLRVYVQHKSGPFLESSRLSELVELEKSLKLGHLETYQSFSNKIMGLGEKLRTHLRRLKSEGKKIYGFGAPAKATTLMHHFGLDSKTLDCIIDDSPWKQGLFSPGLHIPIYSREILQKEKPDVILILAWNFAEQIVQSNRDSLQPGGRFLVPVPEFKEVLC